MMDLDEAIKHCEEVMMENLEKTKDRNASDPIAINCGECAEEHLQLTEWLKELKAYKEKETCETCGHYKAYQHGADITTMDDECGGCCSWNSKWIPKTCGDAISRQAVEKITWEEPNYTDALNVLAEVRDKVRALPFVIPQQRMGRWIEVIDEIREEIHATAEMHEDGDYYLRDEWIDEIIDKYLQEVDS